MTFSRSKSGSSLNRPPRQAWVLEPRMMFDAAAVVTAVDVAAQVAPTDTAPGVEATSVHATVTLTDSSDSFTPIDLFQDVTVAADTGSGTEGKALTELVITVNRSGANQALVIDGKQITLETGSGTTRDTNGEPDGYAYQVTVSGDTTTITISLDSYDNTPSDAATLIDGIAYLPRDNSVAGGDVTVTLKSLSDESDSATLDIHSTITIDSKINVAPVVDNDDGLNASQILNDAGLAQGAEIAYAADGKYAYAASRDGALVVYAVSDNGTLSELQRLTGMTGLDHVTDMALGDNALYILNDKNIITLTVATDGTLGEASMQSIGDSAHSISLSDDGSLLFAGANSNGLYVYNVDATTGALQALTTIEDSITRSAVAVMRGDYLFVVARGQSDPLVVYQRSGTGSDTTFSQVALAELNAWTFYGSNYSALAVSADGSRIYLPELSDGVIYAYNFNNGTLSKLGQVELAGLTGIALSENGSQLYATTADGVLHIYTLNNRGELTTHTSISDAGGENVAVANGAVLTIGSGELVRYNTAQTYTFGTAPIVIADGLTMSDGNLDLLNQGAGNYNGASITVSRDTPSANDQFAFNTGNDLTLQDGKILLSGVEIATFSQEQGQLTVTFTADVSKATANAVLHQITYSSSQTTAGNITLNVTVNDGELDSNLITIALVLAANSAPTLSTTPADTRLDLHGGSVTLFSSTSVNTGETGQSLTQLSLSIEGLSSPHQEYLTLDGTRIDLSSSSEGTTTSGYHYSYQYDAQSGTGTLVLNHDAGISSVALGKLVDDMRYSTGEESTSNNGTRTFTLTGIQDNGGTANGGEDSATLDIVSRVELALNQAPAIDASYTPDSTVFYNDGALSGYSDRVSAISVSQDGKTLLVTGSEGNNNSGKTYLRVYARDAESGQLTLLQSFTQGEQDDPATTAIEVDGLNTITTLVQSQDGSTLYVAGYGATGSASVYSLVQFNRDATTGELSYVGIVATQGVDGVAGLDAAVSEIVLSDDGTSLYTINGVNPLDNTTGKSTISFFSRDTTSGALTYVGSLSGSPLSAPSGIAISSDGRSVYLSNRGNASITVLARDAETSSLTYVTTINKTSIAADANSAAIPTDDRYLSALQDIVISPDNRFVYVSSGDMGTLSIFSRNSDTGALTYAGTLNLYSAGYTASNALALRDLAMSEDGSALYVAAFGGKSVLVFARDAATGTLTYRDSIALSAVSTLNHIAVSPDGYSLYAGVSTFFGGLDVFHAGANASYSQTVAGAFSNGITLSDKEMDAAGDYNGASISIAREGTASDNDHFAFQEGNGLTLSGSTMLSDGNAIATLNIADGTVSVVFTDSVSKDVVNQVLHQLTYRNDGDVAGSAIPLTLTFSDGSKASTLALTLVPNKAPVVNDTDYALAAGTAGQAYEQVLPEDLFRDPEGDSISLQLEDLPDGLTFDAETRTLSGTLTLNSAGQFTINVVATDATGASAEHTLTLNVASDPTQLPTLGGESSALTKDLTMDWFSDPDTYTNVLGGVKDTALSADGHYLYVVSSPDGASAMLSQFTRNDDGTFSLTQTFFATSDNDSVQQITTLAGASEVILSADQQSLYVVGSDSSSVTLFSIGSDGALTPAGTLDQSALDGHTVDLRSQIVAQGDYLFLSVAQPDSDNDSRSVLVFQRQSDGSLNLVDQAENLVGASRLAVDASGSYLFVSGSGDTVGITAYRIGEQGELTQVSQLTASGDTLYYISALTLSPDGKTLYAINADVDNAALLTLQVGEDGQLTLASTIDIAASTGDSGAAPATDIVVSADGTALFMVGSAITLFSRAEDGSLTLKQTIDSGWDNALGISFSSLQNIELSADGKQLILTGDDKIHILNVGTAGASYTEGDPAIVLLPSGRLSDPQLDTLNGGEGDYKGATITLGRQDGARAEDSFGFSEGNGLTLTDGQIIKDGVAIATFSQSGNVVTVTFIATTTKADAQNVLRQITYQNTSQDPEHAGSTPTFTFSLNDGDNNITTLDITVALTGVNDPATFTTTVLNPEIPGNGEFVKLFKDTQIDTIESGQTLWQLVLTVDASGPNEAISVGGSTILLEQTNGTPSTAGGIQYSVSVQDGKATVTLYVARGGSETAALVDSIGYNYLGSDPSGERHLTLSIKENSYNGSAPDTPLPDSITLTLVAAAEANTAPTVIIPGTSPAYTERGDAILLAPEATVTDAQMDALNGGKGNYDGATLTITLGDGKSTLDQLGINAGNGLTLSGSTLQKEGVTIGQVTLQDGVLTLRFNADAGTIPTTADVQNTLRQITYASDSHTPATQVAVAVTLSDRYLTSTVSALTIEITPINDAPIAANDPVLAADALQQVSAYSSISGLGTVTSVTRTTDGSAIYISDDQGAIALFQRDTESGELTYVRTFAPVDGVDGLRELQLSADGNSLYALRSDGNAIVWYSRDADGNLTHQATLVDDYEIHHSNLYDMQDIALSDDGKTLYVINNYNVLWFSRDTSTGALTFVGNLEGSMWSEPYLWQPTEIVSHGDLLFVTTASGNGSSVIAYQRDASGQPTLLGYIRDVTDSAGNSMTLSGVQHISVSDDGTRVFVASEGTIDAFTLDTATGVFTFVARIATQGTVNDIALSADAGVLYVTQSDGALTRYVLDGQTLIQLDTVQNGTTGPLLTVDGGVIALGNGVSALAEVSRLPVHNINGAATVVAPAITFSDAELDAADSYQGASITLQRSDADASTDVFSFVAGNGFTLANGVISKDGQPVASFNQVDGKLTVTFTAALSRADAITLARQISWQTSTATGATATLSLVFNDGEISAPAQTLTIALSTESNQAPIGHEELFTPPTAQVGVSWLYTLPPGLFSDAENEDLALSVSGLPDGLRYDATTRTLSGNPNMAGSFTLTFTAQDSAGNNTALNVTLTIAPANDTPTTPENPTNGNRPNPVILMPQRFNPFDAPHERDREQAPPLGEIVADLTRPTAPAPAHRPLTAPLTQPESEVQRSANTPWSLDPIVTTLMPTLETVNFSARSSQAQAENTLPTAESGLFQRVPGQGAALEAAFSGVQGSLQPDGTGALAFTLPQGIFSVRDGNAALTLQLANGRPLPAWITFDARSGVVRITDASALQVNQIQLALRAQAADGTSRIVPITLQTVPETAANLATDRGALIPVLPQQVEPVAEIALPTGKTAFSEQLRQQQPQQDALLAALRSVSHLQA